MDLKRLLTDDAYVEDSSGRRSGPFKTKFGTESLIFYDDHLDVSEGDVVVQQLPGGRERKHTVVDVQHSSGISGAIAPHVTVTVRTRATVAAPAVGPALTTYNISGTNVQVGNHNAQHITASFQTLISDIDKSDFPPEQKAEAKGRLLRLLESPVVLAILGGAAQGLVGSLSA